MFIVHFSTLLYEVTVQVFVLFSLNGLFLFFYYFVARSTHREFVLSSVDYILFPSFWLYPLFASPLPFFLPPSLYFSLFLFLCFFLCFSVCLAATPFLLILIQLAQLCPLSGPYIVLYMNSPKLSIYLRPICLSDLQSENWILFSMYSCYFDITRTCEVGGVSTEKKCTT